MRYVVLTVDAANFWGRVRDSFEGDSPRAALESAMRRNAGDFEQAEAAVVLPEADLSWFDLEASVSVAIKGDRTKEEDDARRT